MITLTEVPVSVLGNMVNVASLTGLTLPISGVNDRNLGVGAIQTSGWVTAQERGTLVGSFNTLTGEWTCPATGWYDINVLYSLAVAPSPFNALFSVAPSPNPNPQGFMGTIAGVNPSDSYSGDPTITPISFPDYFGAWVVGVTDDGGNLLVCATEQVVTYNTSIIQLSASYTCRYVVSGDKFVCRYLNKTKNNIVGQVGNSYHFSVTHLY
jgi:hypothetical protein